MTKELWVRGASTRYGKVAVWRQQALSRDTRTLVSLGNSAATRCGGMVGSRANHCVHPIGCASQMVLVIFAPKPLDTPARQRVILTNAFVSPRTLR
jgi:alkylhydroperoxidase/carboxymuconolactone decarboxylase family protein YurZ